MQLTWITVCPRVSCVITRFPSELRARECGDLSSSFLSLSKLEIARSEPPAKKTRGQDAQILLRRKYRTFNPSKELKPQFYGGGSDISFNDLRSKFFLSESLRN